MSHSFIKTSFARAIGLLDTASSLLMCVESPMGNGSLIHSIYRGVEIIIGRLSLATDLLVLYMEGYDVILGMDWLGGYRAMVDCYDYCVFHSEERYDPGSDASSRVRVTHTLILY